MGIGEDHRTLVASLGDQARMLLGKKAWGDDLARRCEAGKVPFFRWHRKLRMPTKPMSKIGLRWSAEKGVHNVLHQRKDGGTR